MYTSFTIFIFYLDYKNIHIIKNNVFLIMYLNGILKGKTNVFNKKSKMFTFVHLYATICVYSVPYLSQNFCLSVFQNRPRLNELLYVLYWIQV